jgi:hypothetical protein
MLTPELWHSRALISAGVVDEVAGHEPFLSPQEPHVATRFQSWSPSLVIEAIMVMRLSSSS